jgi:alanyl-tRNA synthetase
MNGSEVRRRFLRFFEERGHRVLRSDSLVPPAEDKSLLFTGAGMNQFKNEFMGRGKPGLTRAATSQKCFRTGDVDNVGRTAWHQTFFEMLGNFSFGDYFKREAILWAWEFVTQEMKLPPERLRVSVYEEDDEAYDIWHKEVGLDPKVIYRYGQHDNFWPADAPKLGPNGLCGPCSEIFYDYSADVGCRKPDCGPSCSCGRFCEFWNLVFQQFDRKDGGVLEPLPTKNIDTGMGFERMVAIMQGVRTTFDTDLFVPIIQAIQDKTQIEYERVRATREGVAFRRIADHVRAAVFCIGDGVLPDNTGRGYVLRKLIRRAALDCDRLGWKPAVSFLESLVPVVAHVMEDQYPDLADRRENIARIISMEEERFYQTLDLGKAILDEKLAVSPGAAVTGADAFHLSDTYGLPLEVTQALVEERGLQMSADAPAEFESEMARQRERARKGTKISADIFGGGPIVALKERGAATVFEGYEKDESEGAVIGIVVGQDLRDDVGEGREAMLVLDRTSYYGESGGEVGDAGLLLNSDARFEVSDSQRAEGMVLHVGKVLAGRIRLGDVLTTRPDVARRAAIRRNHTATHLMHHALREVLGRHAEQAGSLVAPDRLRFDFHHTQAVTEPELRLVEDKVNEKILANTPVGSRILPIAQAKAEGAMALFGEKYGDEVRLLDIGGYSKELCGGLHCHATGDIGLFRIVSESSVAAGIRRIEAATGLEALRLVRAKEDLLDRLSESLGAPEARLVERAEQLSQQIRELRKDLQKAKQSSGRGADDYLKAAKEIGGAKLVAAKVEGATADDLRALVDQLRRLAPSHALALGSVSDERVNLIVALSKDLVARGLHAGKIAGEAAKLVGGGGGGKPDMAQAGGKDPSGLDKAIETAARLIAEKL